MPTAAPWLTDAYHVLKPAPLPDPEAFETILQLYLLHPSCDDLETVNELAEAAFRKAGWDDDRIETEAITAIIEAATNVIQAGSAHLAVRLTHAHQWFVVAVSGLSTFDVVHAVSRANHACDPDRQLKERGRGIYIMHLSSNFLAYTKDGSRVYLGFRR